MSETRGIAERNFQLLVESIADYAIYMMDLKGQVQSWNPAAEKIKGYRADEIIGQRFERFFTPEDRAAGKPAAILEAARREGHAENEGWRVRKDGSRFWAHATVHAIRDETGALIGFGKVTRDMTDKRAAQQALIDSERRFRFLVEGVVDYAIYMLDVNGAVTNWNRGAERIKGYQSEDVVGRHFSMFYTPQDRQAGLPARALERANREGRFAGEGWRVRKDGERFWASVVIDPIFDDEGRHIGYAKITRDITDQKIARERLEASERQFRMLVAGLVDYALYMLDPNGVVSNWNAGAEHIKGYAAEEVVGRHFSMFYTEADRAAGLPTRALQTAREQGRYEAEAWRVRKDGTLFWASVVLDAIRDEDGKLVGFAKITRDITERRNAQLELQKANERLGQAQKMEALGQLTGGVAHDFNNLLMVVSGQAQLLRKRVAEDARALRALDAIEVSAKRGQELTRHLLAFARRQRLSPMALSLSDRATALRELLAGSLGRSISISIDLPKTLWNVRADPGELELALLNMAVNARDAMPSGGSLSISGENVALLGGEIDAETKGDFVAISISDTGAGIPPDVLARIFEPFFTTKDVNRGTGLGLSQVYGFAEQSGGRVRARSELGHGTTFTLYLPRTLDAPGTLADASPAGAGRALTVMVVEDNPEVAEVAAGLLEQLGNRTEVVTNAEAALRALAEGSEPDLVFSDVVMAGEMDGLALARAIRERKPHLPILLATGYSKAVENIGTEFPILAKPYHLSDLSQAIGRLLRERSPQTSDEPA